MTRYMLDTHTVSHLIRAHPAIFRHVLAVPMAAVCSSSITEGELLFGLARRPEAKRLHTAVREFLRRADVQPWDSGVAECYGAARAAMERQRKTLGPLHLLIASHGLHSGTVLVTNDRAFAQVNGLKLEDWTANAA
jgi:tRNA(fMet)-specific endonuclease VapC